MPLLRPVSSLEKLCTTTIASHLLDVFSSWYTVQQVWLGPRLINADCQRDIYNLKNEFALENCYYCDSHDNEGSKVETNKWLINILTHGDFFNDFIKQGRKTKKGLVPVPLQYETETPETMLLTNKMKDCLSCDIEFARPVMQDILSTVLDLIAQRVKIPRPTQKTRCYHEDLDFINILGFLLRVSVTSLLSKTVNTLDFSSVSHLVYRWKLLCKEGVTLMTGMKVDSPYFDIFGYALDITLPELRTLKYLKVPHCVHDNLVRKVAFLCPNLETLILRCSPDCTSKKRLVPRVTDLGVLCGLRTGGKCPDGTIISLRGCRNLVTLELPEHYKEYDINHLACELLSKCPKLECLIGAPMINVHQYIDLHHHCLIQPVKLTNFHHEKYQSSPFEEFDVEYIDKKIMEWYSNKDLSQLSTLFPEVKEVWLRASNEDVVKVLTNFPSSEKITLFQNVSWKLVPIEYLKSVTVLNMNHPYDSFSDLRQSCPNLQELTIRCRSLPVLDNARQEKSTFPNLHTLKFHNVSTLDPDQLITILAACPALLYFELKEAEEAFEQLHVAILESALPYFEKLQKFVYKVRCFNYDTYDLTMDSLRSMISYCPDLKYVGHLGTWNVTSEEVNVLKEEVKANNWDLEIVW